jgi:hypothetical protein
LTVSPTFSVAISSGSLRPSSSISIFNLREGMQ